MKVIVFGGKGFLGSHVVDELRARGHEVKTYDLVDGQDILDAEAVARAAEDQEIIYNFAGHADLSASRLAPRKTLSANIIGNLNILFGSLSAKRFIYASTVYVFSKKGSYYGISKQAAERCVEEFGVPYTILRYGTVYGPRSDHKNRIYGLIYQALNEGKMYLDGTGKEEREFIHVKDAAKLSVDILDGYENKHVMLTGNERYTYTSVMDMISEIMDESIQPYVLDETNLGDTHHYDLTPYSYQPPQSLKLMANPYIDLGQGLLETIEDISARIREKS